VRQSFLAHLPARGFHPEPSFMVAQLVNDAGVVGAADLARIHAGAGIAGSGIADPVANPAE
jgi:glucokinase